MTKFFVQGSLSILFDLSLVILFNSIIIIRQMHLKPASSMHFPSTPTAINYSSCSRTRMPLLQLPHNPMPR